MELKHLRSFLAVARELSFARAARGLHLSQPALSTQIMTLESDLGVRLFERNRRMVRLTVGGESLRADAEVILRMANEAAMRAARATAGDEGHLRIAFVASAIPELVPGIALTFRKRYPRVTLDLMNMKTVQQEEALIAGTIDAGFVRLPITAPVLTVTQLHSEPFSIVVSKNHPLAREKALNVSHLAREPFIAYGRRWAPEFADSWLDICRRGGFSPVIVQETGEMDTALALVAAGMGVGLFPEGIARRHRRSLVVKSLTRETVRSRIGIAVRVSDERGLVRNFLAIAKATARS